MERIDLLTDIELSSTFILSKKTKITEKDMVDALNLSSQKTFSNVGTFRRKVSESDI